MLILKPRQFGGKRVTIGKGCRDRLGQACNLCVSFRRLWAYDREAIQSPTCHGRSYDQAIHCYALRSNVFLI